MIAVWFSCGAASAVAAKLTIENYDDVRVIYNPVINEHPDNLRFLKDVEKWIGQKIELATNPKYPNGDINEVFKDRRLYERPQGCPLHWRAANLKGSPAFGRKQTKQTIMC